MPAKKTDNQSTPGSSFTSELESDRAVGAVCYFGIFWIIPFVVGRKSPFVMFHAKQAIVLSIAWFAVVMLSWIPLFNIFIAFPASIILIIINVLAILKAWHGEKWELPFLARYVKTLNL